MKLKISTPETDAMAVFIAKKNHLLPYHMCWEIAHSLVNGGYGLLPQPEARTDQVAEIEGEVKC